VFLPFLKMVLKYAACSMARGSAVFGRNPRFIARHNMDLPGEDPQDDGDHVPELLEERSILN
jgi:hypothetical protein